VSFVPNNIRVPISQLDSFARQQWEGILGYMVGSSAVPIDDATPTADPSPGVIELLKDGHLIELSGSSFRAGAPKITKEGFAFVLQDVNTQVWSLLFQYVDAAEDLDMEKVAVLSFLFLVSSLELGLAYSKASLDDTQRQILQDLTDFGIVYQPDGGRADHFYPTRLATALTSDSATALSSTNTALGSSLAPSTTGTSTGFIIIETNFRVYAYTSSPLQIALLSLFINLRSRHPNLITGKMTKASVQRAVKAGITAEQIIAYLTSHAHPQMRRHAAAEQRQAEARNAANGRIIPTLPATILDQIHLWQLERDRMTTTSGFLLKDFDKEREYAEVCKYADEIGVLVWKSDKKRCFFVNRLEGVKAFLQERRERPAAS
jgi:transcription initiation factor TFIIH subunit 4